MRIKRILSFLFLLLPLYGTAQEKARIMFYNVENLYDTKDNPKTNDDEFMPKGQLRWTEARYKKKLKDLSRVIESAGEGSAPLMVGMSEVENASVLDDLTKRTSLDKYNYNYLVTSSRDSRGSNVALLYRRDKVELLHSTYYRPNLFSEFFRTTRDILFVSCKVGKDTLDVFVCHFPSRREGIAKTKPHRMRCAEVLKQKTDSLFAVRTKANIIVMGDFNDYPQDESLYNVLDAKAVEGQLSNHKLYNLFYDRNKPRDAGSYKYKGKWNYVDQLIVSGSLLKDGNNIKIVKGSALAYSAPFMLDDDNKKNGGYKPLRTYVGFKYLGGASDHLPVCVELILR